MSLYKRQHPLTYYDARYVLKTGDVMTGSLELRYANPQILITNSATDGQWSLNVTGLQVAQIFSDAVHADTFNWTYAAGFVFNNIVQGTQLKSSVSIGTAPLVVSSTTQVTNLNASLLIGGTWAVPGAIGATTPSTAAFTTISATGQITSTLATGTAPFVVASTTNVANLNASSLTGSTIGTSGAKIPLLSTSNTWAATQTMRDISLDNSLGVGFSILCSADNTSNLGSSSKRFGNISFGGTLGDGTITTTLANLPRLNAANTFTAIQTINNDVKVGTAGKGFFVKEGSNAKMGTGTLSAGTATISTTAVTTNSRVFLTDTGSSVVNVGSIIVSSISTGTSFTVTSTNALDTSTFNWIIFDPA